MPKKYPTLYGNPMVDFNTRPPGQQKVDSTTHSSIDTSQNRQMDLPPTSLAASEIAKELLDNPEAITQPAITPPSTNTSHATQRESTHHPETHTALKPDNTHHEQHLSAGLSASGKTQQPEAIKPFTAMVDQLRKLSDTEFLKSPVGKAVIECFENAINQENTALQELSSKLNNSKGQQSSNEPLYLIVGGGDETSQYKKAGQHRPLDQVEVISVDPEGLGEDELVELGFSREKLTISQSRLFSDSEDWAYFLNPMVIAAEGENNILCLTVKDEGILVSANPDNALFPEDQEIVKKVSIETLLNNTDLDKKYGSLKQERASTEQAMVKFVNNRLQSESSSLIHYDARYGTPTSAFNRFIKEVSTDPNSSKKIIPLSHND